VEDNNPQREITAAYSLDCSEDEDEILPLKPPAQSNNSTLQIDSDDDDDMKLAKEMAMAIAQNPSMTSDSIRELMNSKRPSSNPNNANTKPKSKSTKKKIASKVKAGGSKMKDIFNKSVGITSGSSKSSKSKCDSSLSPKMTVSKPLVRTILETEEALIPMDPSGELSTSARESVNVSATSATTTPTTTPRLLGDYLEGSTSREDDDLSPLNNNNNRGQIRMTGIVWKLRSGLGKYSVSAAWERRRIILRGSKLMYYRFRMEASDDQSQDEISGDESSFDGSARSGGGGGGANSTRSWLEQSLKQATVLVASKGAARGVLDLVKENASVGASFGHSGSPTPFALSIKVLAQTKWKLCFDTHGELMQWMAAMTDAIVQGSVDVYNAQILQANDPSQADSMSQYYAGTHGQLSEPPLIASFSGQKGTSGHRLWVTGHYNVKSEDYPDDVSEGELEDVSSVDDDDDDDDDDDNKKVTKRSASSNSTALEFTIDPESGRGVWTIPEHALWQVYGLFNLAVVLSRASSTTVEYFWYILTFTNIFFFGFLTKDKVGGTIQPKITSHQKITPEMARRLSMDVGMPVQPTVPGKKDQETPGIPKESAHRPVAGSTTMQIDKPTDLPLGHGGHVFAGWRLAPPASMQIRSHGYKSTKKKVPSPGELYKCVNVDIFEARSRYPDMASRVQMPTVSFEGDDFQTNPKTWNAPDTFVVSIAIPTDPPKLYSSSQNGGGYTVTMYFAMTQETRDILKRVTADGYNHNAETHTYPDGDIQKSKINAVRLLDEWCRRAPTDDSWMARFKVVPNAQNLRDIGLPAWIGKYNGKPFLIKRPGETGFLYRHPEKSIFEFDISLHPFPYLAKQGICFMKDQYFKKVLVTFGFLIEGRSDDELPECLIGLMQLCYPDPMHAIQGEDFLEGRSPVSVSPVSVKKE
jgi:hypothetical protein